MSGAATNQKAKLFLLCLLLVAVVGGIVWLKRVEKDEAAKAAAPSAIQASSEQSESESETEATDPRLSDASVVADARSARRDRAARDALRQRIYRSLGHPAPTDSKPLRPSAIAREAGVLDAAYVQERIREDFLPLAKECYAAALERDATLAGRLVMSFNIVGDDDVGGIVESAETTEDSTLVDKEMLYCMRESMLSMSFEAPAHGGSVSVVYPFVFDPHGPPDE
jgi:hypothetical protein